MNKYILYPVLIFCLLLSCKNADDFQDMIYFTGTEKTVTAKFTIDGPTSMGISVSASTKVAGDMGVKVKATPEMIDGYNKANGKQYVVLPEGSYNLSTDQVTISEGKNVSDQIKLSITSLDKFEEGVTYCMPVTIVGTDSGLPILEPCKTLYVVIDRTIITHAASLKGGNCFRVPFFKNQDLSSVPNVSMETRVFVNKFQANSPYISSLMGIEENFLLRFGDVTINKEQLQLAGGGYPLTVKENFATGKWYHVAIVYDGSKLKFYVNGVLNATTDAPRGNINLADTYSGGFHIGYSAGGRYLDGAVSETRVWTKALTEAEIMNNMCYVDPTASGLLAYWRFNEGSGNDIKDWTGNGYDLKSNANTVWIEGVRCPE